MKVRGLRNFQGAAVRTDLREHMACNREWEERWLARAIRIRPWTASATRLRRLSALVGHGMPVMVLVPRSVMIEKINP